ncbi:MAG: MMPL family transporter [Bacillota bacterium]|nr:MMPL family transporter [Bacillota bacterium]
MKRLSEAVIRHRKSVIILTLILCALSAFAMTTVKVNYNLSDYLSASSPSRQALDQVKVELPSLQLYLPGLSVQEALEEKQNLLALSGVNDVLWLDNVMDLRNIPAQTILPELFGQYYNEGPLYQLTIPEAEQARVVANLRETYPDALLKGTAADNAEQINVTMGQVSSIMVFLVPLTLLILFLATRHWFEPVLFLLAIGTAILLNEGSNIIFGEVSYITQACSAILQLAVSIDYAVFLLHRFADFREEGLDAVSAIKKAMQVASGTIASSALTTVFGFLALLLMQFKLGMDMGLVLAKGVLLSYLSVMIFLPAVAVSSVKLIDKTAHRSFIPSFKWLGRGVMRFGAPLAAIVLLSLPFAYLMQGENTFIYGSGGMHSPQSPIRQESRALEERFSAERMMLLTVREDGRLKELELSAALKKVPGITSVISYVDTVSAQIPPQMLPSSVTSQFYQDGYSRFILQTDRPDESPEAFEMVEELRKTIQPFYKESYLLGEAPVNYDLKTSISADNLTVFLAGVLSIGLVLLFNFKNLTIPLILLLVIEGSIWLNMAAPFITGNPLNYIGYQIVSSVQLGATVDYGILMSQRYLEGRQTMPAKQAGAWALEVSTGSILPPAMILAIAGFILGYMVQGNQVISEMGIIIGRGAVFSCLMVILVLPKLLVWLDKLIFKTNLHKRKASS